MADLTSDIGEVLWYHTIEFPNGVVTPGLFDVRSAAKKVPIPQSLAGKRCLDVGTADGFWAFEMERRGADEVVAIDVSDPAKRDVTVNAPRMEPGPGGAFRQARAFDIAHDALGSRVEFRNVSVYDLDPAVVGEFDFVFMGSILVHLRDPVLALMKVNTVTRGILMNYEAVSRYFTLIHPRVPAALLTGLTRSDWWLPNIAGLRRMIEAGGFQIEEAGRITYVARRRDKLDKRWALRHPFRTGMLYAAGIPQSWVMSRPRPSA